MKKLTVFLMYLCALGKTVAKHIDMGVMIITPENMDSPEAQKLLNPPI